MQSDPKYTKIKANIVYNDVISDQHVRVYDTTKGHCNQIRSIRARDVGWSVLDVAFR